MTALLLTAGLVAACSSGSDSSSGTSSGAPAGSSGATSSGGTSGGGTVIWVDAGGHSTENSKKAILDPFTAETGITVETLSPPDIAQIKAMTSAGNAVWDVVGVGPSQVLNNCGTMFNELDKSLYDSLDKYPPNSVTPCMVPTSKSASIFSYNTEKFTGDNVPTTIADFFDPEKFPGKRVIFDDAGSSGIYEAALVADGVDPDKLYPLDFARAEAVMDRIKDDLFLAPTFSAAQEELESNNWALTLMLGGRSIASETGGAKMAPVWDYTTYYPSAVAVVKGAPNLENALQLAAFTTRKDIELAYAAANGLYPMHPDIKPEEVQFTDIQRRWNAFETSGRGTVTMADPTWYSQNTNALVESFTKWKVG